MADINLKTHPSVKKYSINGNTLDLDIQNLSGGVYIMLLTSETGAYQAKVMKQ